MDNRLPIPASHSQIHWQLPFNISPTWGTLPYWTCGNDTWQVLIMRKSGKKTLICYQCNKLKHGADHEKIWGPPFSQVKAANDIRRVIKIRIVQKGFFSDVSHTPIFQGEQWYCEAPEGRDMIIADNYIPPYDHDPQESAESSEII